MRLFLLALFAILFIGGTALFLFEKFFPDRIEENPSPGDPHGVTSGRSRVYAYIACAVLGFFAMLLELWYMYR